MNDVVAACLGLLDQVKVIYQILERGGVVGHGAAWATLTQVT